MMYNYPFYNVPRYYKYNRYYNIPKDNYKNNIEPIKTENRQNDDSRNIISLPQNDKQPFFEIFGIELFFDDILLICLIFFLYKEGVEDQYLFISLILLLLS